MSNKKELKVSEVRDFVCDVQAYIDTLDLMACSMEEYYSDQAIRDRYRIAFDSVMKETKAKIKGFDIYLSYGVKCDGSETLDVLNMHKSVFLTRGIN